MNFKAILALVIEVAGKFAATTASEIDDKVVALAKAIYDHAVLSGWFEKKTEQEPGTLGFEAEPPAEVVEAFSAAGFSLDDVFKYLPLLLELFAQVKRWFGK